jgi:tetratricopeptide (TPR) repeat protein
MPSKMTRTKLTTDSFWGVFWIDVSSENTAQDGFLAISRALGHSVQTVQDCLQVLASATRRWLLILDNADDPEFDYASYFPTGNRGAVLLTSRIPECRQYSTVGTESLGSLDMSHSTQLLFKAAQIPEQSWHACRTHALEITELLGSHTLALIQAGAYIGQGYCRLDQYAEKFQQQRRQLLSHHPAQQQSRYQNVYATFEASVDVLKLAEDEVGQDALDLLGLLSMLHNSTMPLQIFQDAWAGARLISRGEMSDLGCTQQEQLSRRTWRPIRPWRSIKISSQPKVQTTAEMSSTLGKVHVSHIPGFINPHHEAWDDSRLKKAIVRLNSLSLITCHYSNVHEGLSMHPLAHAWAKDRMKKDEQERVWVRATCTLTMSLGRSGIWRTYESQLRPHAQALVSPTFRSAFAYGPLETMYPLMVQCGWILIAVTEHKLLQGLVDSMYQALDITPRKPGRKHMSIWRLASTAAVYLRHTKLAIFLLENITKVEQETLPEANPVRLASQYNLARAYNDNAEPEIAIPLLEHIIPIFKSISTHQDWLLSSQIELNRAYNSAGQVGKDVELLQDVIKAQEKLGNKHNILKSMHGLGIAYIANGQRENAIHTLMHVVSTYELMLDKTHPDRLSSQHELARAYNMDGQFDKSIPLLQHVVRLQEKILDADDYCLIASRYTLGSAYLAHGQTTEAIKHLEYVVDMYSRILDQTRSERLSAQYELARAYLDTKELDKALELMRHVVGVRRRVLNNAHPHRLQSARLLKDLVDGTVYD